MGAGRSLDDSTRIWLIALGFVACAATVPMLILRSLAMALEVAGSSSQINPESADKLVWVATGLTAIALFFVLQSPQVRDRLAESRLGLVLLWISLASAIVSISWVQPIDGASVNVLWFGFGVGVCLATLALVPFVSRFGSAPVASITRFLAAASIIVALVWYLPLLIQPPWGVMDLNNSSYVINELLAPAAGAFPLGDFIPQYTSLLGWPIAPIITLVKGVGGGSLVYFVASMYLSFLAIATMGGVVYLAWRVLPIRIRSLAVLLTIPLILVKVQPPFTTMGSISGLFSAVPVRTLPAVAVAVALIWFARNPRTWRALLLGVVCGLSALNNFEFGVPTLVAALIVLAAFGRLRGFAAYAGATLGGAALVFVVYFTILAAAGQPLRPSYWTAIALSFGSGFGSIAMPITGTYVLILMILGAGAVVGLIWLVGNRTVHSDGRAELSRQRSAALVAAFIGLVGLGSFGYYVNRSVSSGQLQIFLLHAALVSVAILGLVRMPDLLRQRSYRGVLTTAIIAIPASLAVASLLQAPDPQYEWARVLPHGSVAPLLVPDAEIEAVRQKLADATDILGGVVPSLAVNDGNFVQLRLGIPNVSVLNEPTDNIIGPFVRDEFCGALLATPGPILTQNVVDEGGQSFCVGLRLVKSLGDGYAIIESMVSNQSVERSNGA